MPTGTWALGWATGDIPTAAEFAKTGCIYDTTLGADAASIDVTGIVGVYATLEVRAYLRGSNATVGINPLIRFNGDSGANYGYLDSGTATGVTGATSITSGNAQGLITAASGTASQFSPLRIVIPHYAGTGFHKAVEFFAGSIATGGNAGSSASTGIWRSTAAINRITVSLAAGNIVTGSRLSIYVLGS